MAFPATFDIQYYRGDTYEFKLYPKDSAGAAFDLAGYDLSNGVKFTIATARGVGTNIHSTTGYARISSDRQYIICAIKPENGAWMEYSSDYVYDIQISKAGAGGTYDSIITLLTGNIAVTEQVTQTGVVV